MSTVSVRLSDDELDKARRLHREAAPRFIAIVAFLIGVPSCSYAAVGLAFFTGRPWMHLVFVAIPTLLVALIGGWAYWQMGSQKSEVNGGAYAKYDLQVTEDGFIIQEPSIVNSIDSGSIVQTIQDGQLVLLYLSQQTYQVLPQRILKDSEIGEMLGARLQDAKRAGLIVRGRALLRGLLWAAIIGAILLLVATYFGA